MKKQNKTQHTPTPWRVELDNEGLPEITAYGPQRIAMLTGEDELGLPALKANGDLIVHAVNNHKRLVAALSKLFDAVGHIPTPATNDGLNLCDAKALAREILREINE